MLHRGGNIQFYVMHVRVAFTYLILKLSTPDIKFTLVCNNYEQETNSVN